MEEIHSNEQYFFHKDTLDHLSTFVSQFEHPCCICAPMLGKDLVEKQVNVSILDIDLRFSHLPGFQQFNLANPTWTGKTFDLIVCDPPFFNLSLRKLFRALRMLAQFNFQQPLLVSYLTRREKTLLKVFDEFNLRPTGYFAKYETVQECAKNEIQFYGNLSASLTAQLCNQAGC